MAPIVSVVIPSYNSMMFLPTTLNSVLQQTFSDFEVLIIDDGSQDNVKDWFTTISDSRVKLFSQENKGYAGACNTGILNAQGKYIAFLDADDVWVPTKLEKQFRCLEDNPEVGLVDTLVFFVDSEGEKLFTAGSIYKPGNVYETMLVKNLVPCGSTPMVRRLCFDTVGVFDESIKGPSDWHMWVRIASQYNFQVIEEPLVHYRQHSSSVSRNTDIMLRGGLQAINSMFDDAPPHLQYKKKESYGNLYYVLALKAYTVNRNYKQAVYLCLRVLQIYPNKCFSRDFIYLFSKIILYFTLSEQGYNQVNRVVSQLKNLSRALVSRPPQGF
ncbi:glycosyl transferase family A [filamentous cyanobacterium CCT1]|nr:glycosyl transferase family A [filamentous cyanobacterium CCT1]PSN81614.1 glycosyl transferase family A [filamentous cyanobacterium CCP4]